MLPQTGARQHRHRIPDGPGEPADPGRTDDPIIPVVIARIMARLTPDATVHTYDDGQLGLVTQAHLLAPVATDFLRS